MTIKQSRYITADTTGKKEMAIRTTELDKVKDDPYVRKSEVQQTVNNSTLPVSSRAVNLAINSIEMPSLDGYATEDYVDQKVDSIDLSDYASTAYVDGEIEAVDARVDSAVEKTTEALNNSSEALENANTALESANTALSVAQGADGKAQDALDTAQSALDSIPTDYVKEAEFVELSDEVNNKRDLDDNVFNGYLQVRSEHEGQGTGVFLQDTDGNVRGQVVASDQGLQLTQYPKDGGLQTFTFPGDGGEIVVDSKLPYVTPEMFGAVGDGEADDTIAIQEAIATGKKVILSAKDYIVTSELEVTTVGQVIQGAGKGYGYGRPDEFYINFKPSTRIILKGNGFKKLLRTRRNPRLIPDDPHDELLSSGVSLRAEGSSVRDLTVWLDCDYTDNSPYNYGADVDVGIFIDSRAGVTIYDVGVIGYFRRSGVLFDVTHATNLSPLKLQDGTDVPRHIVFEGGDGTVMFNPLIVGANQPLSIVGAVHSDSNTYYDDVKGLVADDRGASGFSDFAQYSGRLYAGYHHTGYRIDDPVVSNINKTTSEQELFTSPASLFIDGWSANKNTTTHNKGALRGISFYGTRFTSTEKFRIRLGLCDEVSFVGRTWIEGGAGVVRNTSGVVIDINDYSKNTYGHICTHENTGSVRADLVTGGLTQKYIYNTDTASLSDSRMRNTICNTEIKGSKYNYIDGSVCHIHDTNTNVEDVSHTLKLSSLVPSVLFHDKSGGQGDYEIKVDKDILNISHRKESVEHESILLNSGNKLIDFKYTPKMPYSTFANLPEDVPIGSFRYVTTEGGWVAVMTDKGWRKIGLSDVI